MLQLAMKNILKGIPLHYQTGILGGAIYILWLGIATYLQAHWYYFGQTIFSYVILFIILLPVFLVEYIHGSLMSVAYSFFNQVPSILQITFLVISFIISDLLFAGLGILIGKKSKDPNREKLRRQIIIVAMTILAVVCICYSVVITIAGFLMPS